MFNLVKTTTTTFEGKKIEDVKPGEIFIDLGELFVKTKDEHQLFKYDGVLATSLSSGELNAYQEGAVVNVVKNIKLEVFE